MAPLFIQLNRGWNAEPVAPQLIIQTEGPDLIASFGLNARLYKTFKEGDRGVLRFKNCSRYRVGDPNDEGFYYGQDRFPVGTHTWGEFYLVYADVNLLGATDDWVLLPNEHPDQRHFLFYMKDETFECAAVECHIELTWTNALHEKAITLDPIAYTPAFRSAWVRLGTSSEPDPFLVGDVNVWARRWETSDTHHMEVIDADGNRIGLPIRHIEANSQVVKFLARRLTGATWEFYGHHGPQSERDGKKRS